MADVDALLLGPTYPLERPAAEVLGTRTSRPPMSERRSSICDAEAPTRQSVSM